MTASRQRRILSLVCTTFELGWLDHCADFPGRSQTWIGSGILARPAQAINARRCRRSFPAALGWRPMVVVRPKENKQLAKKVCFRATCSPLLECLFLK